MLTSRNFILRWVFALIKHKMQPTGEYQNTSHFALKNLLPPPPQVKRTKKHPTLYKNPPVPL